MLCKLVLLCILSADLALSRSICYNSDHLPESFWIEPTLTSFGTASDVTPRKLVKISDWEDATKTKFNADVAAIKTALTAKPSSLDTAIYEKIEAFYNDVFFVLSMLGDTAVPYTAETAPKKAEAIAPVLELTQIIYDAFHTPDRALVKADPQLALFMSTYGETAPAEIKKTFHCEWTEIPVKFPAFAPAFENIRKFYHLFVNPGVSSSVELEAFLGRDVDSETKAKADAFLIKTDLEKVKQAGVDITNKAKEKDENEVKKALSEFDASTSDFLKLFPIISYAMLDFEKFDVLETKDMLQLLVDITGQYKMLFTSEDKEMNKKITDATPKTAEQLKHFSAQYTSKKDKKVQTYLEQIKANKMLETSFNNLEAAAKAHPLASESSSLGIIIAISAVVVVAVLIIIAVAVYFLRKDQ